MKKAILLLVLISFSFLIKAMNAPLDSIFNQKTRCLIDGIVFPYDTAQNRLLANKIKCHILEICSQRKAISKFGEKARNGLAVFSTLEKKKYEKMPNKYYITGSVDYSYTGNNVMLFRFNPFNLDEIVRVDTAMVVDGTFGFEGKPDNTNVSLLVIGDFPKKILSCEVVLERGDISVQLDSGQVIGTPLNDKYQKFRDDVKVILDRYVAQQRTDVDQEYYQYCLSFIKSNIHNAVGKAVFYQNQDWDYEQGDFESIYLLADDTLKANPFVKMQILETERRKKEKEQRNLLEGKSFSDFVMTDILGNSVKISDYIGKSKILLLDVWASWCAPCRADMPHLKDIYKDYADKGFSVLGISIDHSEKSWKKAICDLDLPWHLALLPQKELSSFKKKYAIGGIPHLILIDQNGKIIMARPELRVDQFLRAVLNSILRNY